MMKREKIPKERERQITEYRDREDTYIKLNGTDKLLSAMILDLSPG